MLSGPNENDRRARGGHRRQRAASFGVTIELRYDDTANINGRCERLGLIKTRLSNVGIHHENDVAGIDCFRDLLHLIEQSSFLLVSARRVHNDDVVLFCSKHLYPLFGNLHRVSLTVASVKRDLGLGCVLPQLIVGSGSERISTDEGTLPALALIKMRKLGASGGLTGTLQAHEHHHVALPLLHLVWLPGRRQQADKLLDNSLLDELALVRRRRILHVHNCLDVLPELSDCSNGNISLQQRRSNLLHHQIQELIIDHCFRLQLAQRACDLPSKIR
mmetsp:Transcript_23120/g.56197  ORF Transcript_23120/g.56197 Transcript_23120/m.56197 type:complete len:275 (-) Transcript_23120:60-884(-)